MSSELFVILPAIYLMKNIDLSSEERILQLRIAFASVVVLVLLLCLYLYQTMMKNKPSGTVMVPPDPMAAAKDPSIDPNVPIPTPVAEYDMAQFKKYLQTVVMGAAITSFIHYKFEINPPLFLQCLLNPMNFFKNPLVKIYILGQKDLARPFKDSNPFAAFLQQQQQPTEPEAVDGSSEQTDAVSQDTRDIPSESVHEADRDQDTASEKTGSVDLDDVVLKKTKKEAEERLSEKSLDKETTADKGQKEVGDDFDMVDKDEAKDMPPLEEEEEEEEEQASESASQVTETPSQVTETQPVSTAVRSPAARQRKKRAGT